VGIEDIAAKKRPKKPSSLANFSLHPGDIALDAPKWPSESLDDAPGCPQKPKKAPKWELTSAQKAFLTAKGSEKSKKDEFLGDELADVDADVDALGQFSQYAEVGEKDQKFLKKLARVKIELQKRKLALDPTQYGLPDLLSLQDAPREAQEKGIREVCAKLVIIPNGPPRPIKLIPVQIEFLTDLFFGYARYAILWKPRGGGGSLVIGVLMWLLAVYKQKSCLDLAGSGEQARAVYNYTKGFWEGLPQLKQSLLADAPMKTETLLKSGASLKCVPASERQVKSKHCPVLILDEACQKQAAIDGVFMDAIQGVFSEPEPIIVMNSTFYFPQGLFQEYWDGAAEKGFKKYKWSIFDTMRKCERTDCFSGCPLSWQKDVLDEKGKVMLDAEGNKVTEWVGCCGKAHETNGFQPFQAVVEAKRVNEGTNIFEVQHMGSRPAWMGTIYTLKSINKCIVKEPTIDLAKAEMAVGIDWGLIGQTCVILAAFDRDFPRMDGPPGKVCILEAVFMTGKLTSEVVRLMEGWVEEYERQFMVYPDGSHPYNNLEMERSGFQVFPVHFVKWKEYGIGNVRKYFVNQRVEILNKLKLLLSQVKRYRRLPSGKPAKKEDHGPDALLCSLLAWPFLEWFGAKVETQKEADQVLLI
jgi:hypothetical protein